MVHHLNEQIKVGHKWFEIFENKLKNGRKWFNVIQKWLKDC
jgi:hypothetical protein